MAIPGFLQSALWSYDLSKVDKGRDKTLIITQVLNHGDTKDLRWLLRAYTRSEILSVVQNPRRGLWSRNTLRTWLAKFKIILDPLTFDVAIKDQNPRPKLFSEYFRQKLLT